MSTEKNNLNNIVKAIPLGGHGEIGKNSWVFECQDEIIIVNFGFKLPGNDKWGVDLVLPNPTYLKENEHKIKALIVTSAHDDSCGGVFYLLDKLNIPKVHVPKLALEYLNKTAEKEKLKSAKVLTARETIQAGNNFKITPIANTSCLPDTYGLIIETPQGRIVYTGSYKIDQTPPDKVLMDYYSYAQAGEDTVSLLISDSTEIETVGYSTTDSKIQKKFNEIIRDVKHRLIIVTSTFEIHKYQIIFDLANKHNKKIYVSGKDIENCINAAIDSKFLTVSKSTLISKQDLKNTPKEELIILTTGHHGNFLQGLSDLANETHEIKLESNDTIVISADPPPGTIRMLARTVDQLYVQKVQVISGRGQDLHFSSHPPQEEAKFIICTTKPRAFIPSHGEERHLVMHANIAESMGVNHNDIQILKNGDIVEIRGGITRVSGKVPSSSIYYNKEIGLDIDEFTMKERETLSAEGTVTVAISLDTDRNIIAGPEIFAEACSFAKGKDWRAFCISTVELIKQAIKEKIALDEKDLPSIKSTVKDTLNKYVIELVGKRPLVNVAIQEVKLAEKK